IYVTRLYKVVMLDKTMWIIPTPNQATDASPRNAPRDGVALRGDNGQVNFYEPAPDKLELHWRRKLGKKLYEEMISKELEMHGIPHEKPDQISLVPFPSGYSLWRQKKGDQHVPRVDGYLFGSDLVHHFRSPAEFYYHLKWLMQGQPRKVNGQPKCLCKYCDGTRTQTEISQELGMYKPGDDKDRSRRGHRGGGGEGSGRRRAPKTSTTMQFKDYR
ncbi:uncharacterized protein BXZ73DRAFT_18741, partial [Epithele typhae]|uniref:uncharacterized protein n=1 Tax=Epithele typhae TaxID=378194 RepID=UPI002007C7F4